MDFDRARLQIRSLIESSGNRSKWNDMLEEYFPESCRIQDIQISCDQTNIWIDQPAMTFTFRDVCLGFELQMLSHPETGSLKHGECLASGKGQIIDMFDNPRKI